MSCTGYVPPHIEQLHGGDPTAGSDCAIACAAMAIRFATCGDVWPNIDKVRSQANLDEPNPPPSDYSTDMTPEYVRAVNAFDDEARDRGYEGIGANATERGRWDDLEPILKGESKWVTTFVDYGVLNDREPSKSGDQNFNGSHAIGVYGYKSANETGDGTVKYKVWDPLCDGRKSSVPKGPTWWKASTLRDACDAYAGGGSGTATWCVTPRSKATTETMAAETQSLEHLLGEARTLLTELAIEFGNIAERISKRLGGNDEGLTLPVHSGVKPDDGPD